MVPATALIPQRNPSSQHETEFPGGTPSAHGVRKTHHPKRAKPSDAAAKNAKPGPKDLPSGGSGTASFDRERLTKPGAAQPRVTTHGTPVWAQPVVPRSGSYHGPSQVAVKVSDRKTAAAAGLLEPGEAADASGSIPARAGPTVAGSPRRSDPGEHPHAGMVRSSLAPKRGLGWPHGCLPWRPSRTLFQFRRPGPRVRVSTVRWTRE
jgi:hypothetical protein